MTKCVYIAKQIILRLSVTLYLWERLLPRVVSCLEKCLGAIGLSGEKNLFVPSEQLYDVWFFWQHADIWFRARVTSFLRFRLAFFFFFFVRTEVIDTFCGSNDKFLQTVMHLAACNRKITASSASPRAKTKCCLSRGIFKRIYSYHFAERRWKLWCWNPNRWNQLEENQLRVFHQQLYRI